MKAGRPRDPEIDERIVGAARDLLTEGGLDAVSVAAVADRAGVTRPTVYRRYADREALALAVLFFDFDRIATRGAPLIPRTWPIHEQLIGLVRPIFAYYAEHPERTSALLQLAMFREAPLDSELNLQMFGFLEDVARRVVEAMNRGELRADTDIRLLISAFFSMYISTAISAARGILQGEDALIEIFSGMLAQHLVGLRTP